MKNFQPLVLNSNEAREPFSGGASEAGVNSTRSNIKNFDASMNRNKLPPIVYNPAATGVNNTRSNIKN